MVRDMLSFLMDMIKDANLIMDYAEDAENQEMPEYYNWFKQKAKERIDNLNRDYNYVCNQIGLKEKARTGDEIAEALEAHLSYQIAEINRRFLAL